MAAAPHPAQQRLTVVRANGAPVRAQPPPDRTRQVPSAVHAPPQDSARRVATDGPDAVVGAPAGVRAAAVTAPVVASSSTLDTEMTWGSVVRVSPVTSG